MRADLAAINRGEAARRGETFQVNERIYGVEPNGRAYPISGVGIHSLTRLAFKALGVYNTFGLSERADWILDRMECPAEDREAARLACRARTESVMLWQELEVSGDLSDGDLIGAWSKILDIDPDGVRVVDTMEDAPSISEARARIVLERWRQSGQFPLHVVIYVRGADLEERVSEPNAGLDVVRRFCSVVKSDCLLSDGDVNPYAMLLVRRTGEVSSVMLDGNALDRDELMLAAGQAAESPFMAVDRRESPRPA